MTENTVMTMHSVARNNVGSFFKWNGWCFIGFRGGKLYADEMATEPTVSNNDRNWWYI